MPKKKTNKAAAKRFRRTASGKLKFHKAGGSHLLGNKSRKQKRRLHQSVMVSKADFRRISAML